jgi:XTP/dITP diphosphohydrolase
VRLLVATTNQHKLREIRHLLGAAELVGLGDLPPVEEPEETGLTFRDNARLKALYYAAHAARTAQAPAITVAEDSGLVIDALGGDPGVHSARYLGADASYAARFADILARLRGQPRPWTARFVCALAVVHDGDVVFETAGTVEGEITEPSGSAGFGYDPIFYFPAFGKTLADVGEADKLAVAHRGVAFRALRAWLEKIANRRQGGLPDGED